MNENKDGRKKILYVITKGNFGGAQRYVYDLATSLPPDQFEPIVACGPSSAQATAGKEGLAEMLRKKEIRVIELLSSQRDINILKDVKTFFEIKKIINAEKPAVIHLNSSKAGGLGALAGRVAGVPKIIFTGHGWAFNENRNIFSKTVILFLHWLTVIFSHCTIVVSRKVKKDIEWLPFLKRKIKVVYNGIENFKPLPVKEARQMLGVADDRQTLILSLSELTGNKGIDIALRAIALLPKNLQQSITYCIAGKGEESEKIKKLSEELGVNEFVKFLGFVPDGKQTLSGADIFLLPSRTEAFPYVVLEAGLVGLPMICSNVGGIPEVIRDMQNGILVHPRNPKEIAEAIIYLLGHQEKSKEFGNEIRKTISNLFSLENMVSQTLKIYSL